jgi:integrase
MLRINNDQYGAIVELLIYTGQRARQISGLNRSEVDFEPDVIVWGIGTIGASKLPRLSKS